MFFCPTKNTLSFLCHSISCCIYVSYLRSFANVDRVNFFLNVVKNLVFKKAIQKMFLEFNYL